MSIQPDISTTSLPVPAQSSASGFAPTAFDDAVIINEGLNESRIRPTGVSENNSTVNTVLASEEPPVDPIGFRKSDLSELEVSSEGISWRTWDDVDDIPSQIIFVTPDEVVMDCLVSAESQEFEERTFPRKFVDGAIPIEVGQLVYIQYRMRPGEVRYKFVPGDGLFDEELFVTEESFDGFEDLDELLD